MHRTRHYILLFALILFIGFRPGIAKSENIDPDHNDSQYAWGENVGWINLEPDNGSGVEVGDNSLTGYMWGENVGWINMAPAEGGVFNDGAGNLSGFAWGENVGWINFAPVGGGVFIDPDTGEFSGLAWGENIGWLNFVPDGKPVKTSWRGTPPCPQVNDLAARAKSGKVQLTWTHVGADSYNIYRKTDGDYALLASTTSTYSTYLDTDVINNTAYTYFVISICGGSEGESSNEVSITPAARIRR